MDDRILSSTIHRPRQLASTVLSDSSPRGMSVSLDECEAIIGLTDDSQTSIGGMVAELNSGASDC